MSLKTGDVFYVPFSINGTDLPANTSQELVSPIDGYISGLHVTVQAAVTTGGNITVKTGDALGTTVAGLTATIANSAAKGTRKSALSTAGSPTRKVAKGDRIAITPASFASAGAVNGHLTIHTSDVSPAL